VSLKEILHILVDKAQNQFRTEQEIRDIHVAIEGLPDGPKPRRLPAELDSE
jgi:hypothetical protein